MTVIEVILPQDPTLITTTDFRSVPEGINLIADGAGSLYLSNDGSYKAVVATGASSLITTYVASATIGGHLAVYQTIAGVAVASSSSISHASKVMGITNSAVSSGENVPVTTSGELIEPTWTFTVGLPIYLSVNGTLTQVLPVVGFILQVGVAISATKILVAIKLPIIL